jgi:carbonic anhydrase
MITQTKETQADMTADAAFELLKEGNARYVGGTMINRDLMDQVHETGMNGQAPHSVVLSCIDSRVTAEYIFDQGVGDIFSARVAGNFVNTDILGSMEFACKLAGSKLIVILGHSKCGAVKGACDRAELGNLTEMLSKITPAVDAVEATVPAGTDTSSGNADFVQKVVVKNVEMTMANLLNDSSVLREMIENPKVDLKMVGGIYNVETGEIDWM